MSFAAALASRRRCTSRSRTSPSSSTARVHGLTPGPPALLSSQLENRTSCPMLDTSQDRPLYRQLSDELRQEVAPGSPRRPDRQRTGTGGGAWGQSLHRNQGGRGAGRRRVWSSAAGQGTFVAVPPLRRAPSLYASFTEAVRARGVSPPPTCSAFGPVDWRPGIPHDSGLEPLITLEGCGGSTGRRLQFTAPC